MAVAAVEYVRFMFRDCLFLPVAALKLFLPSMFTKMYHQLETFDSRKINQVIYLIVDRRLELYLNANISCAMLPV